MEGKNRLDLLDNEKQILVSAGFKFLFDLIKKEMSKL